MTLSDISIRNPVFAWMLMAALIIFGLYSYRRLGVSQLPDVDYPVVSVNLSWQGAAPEVMESDIVDVVEGAVMGIQGIDNVRSTIQLGTATVTIQFVLGRNIDAAEADVQAKIASAQRLLPKDMDPPIINKVNPTEQPIMWTSVTGDTSLRNMEVYVQTQLQDQLTTVEGVGNVILGGYVDPNMRIWVDQTKLKAYELTVGDVINAIEAQSQEVPAGYIETPRQQLNVRVMGEARTPQDFENIVIPRRAGGPVFTTLRVGDVARVEHGLADVQRVSHTNGQISVGLGVQKQPGSNEVAVGRRVLTRIVEVQHRLPKGMELNVVFNRTTFIEQSIQELLFTLILSALVTSAVCWIFLGSWSATLNILLAIPTSILGTFLVIDFLGFTINTFTALGLTLAVGIVVDDAIMVLENIVRYREEGKGRVEAAQVGARQITFAATATSLALVAIFLPVAFMTGIIGRLFFQYGMTISIAVLLSLLEALTLTPMRTSQFLQVKPRITAFGRWVETAFKATARGYRRSLDLVLNNRWLVIFITLVFFVASLLLFRVLRQEFVPTQDMSMLLVQMQTPPGSSLEFTENAFRQAETYLSSRPEIKRYFGIIGGFQGGQVNQANMFISLKDPKDRPIAPPFKHRPTQTDMMNLLRAQFNKIPQARAFVQDLSQSGFTAQRGFPIEFTVQGPSWDSLSVYQGRIREGMTKSGLMTDVNTDYQPPVPEIHVIPDRAKASTRGVDVQVIAQTVDALIGGEPIVKYTEGGQRYDVRVQLVPTQRNQMDEILALQVWNNRGQLVTLKDVVSLTQVPTSPTLTRYNRERAIGIFSNVAQGKSQTAALDEVNRIIAQVLPQGYHIVLTGGAQAFQESFRSLLLVLLMGILVSYMVLASQFNSFLQPLIILMALPFSISGALIGLWAGKQSINIYSFIGVILLMGLVKKNSILLVDFTNHMRVQGAGVNEAIKQASPIRLRPILMTSLAIMAAALPPALGLGPGAETRVPMAVAVIGGVFFSTLLTLFVVPAVYSLASRLERKKYEQVDKAPLAEETIPEEELK